MCICAYIYMCLCRCLRVRMCVYIGVYMHIYIYTHRHTRTYKDGNTHPCECVCVCVCMWAHTRIYGEGVSILQKGLFCPKLIKASDNSTSKRETTPEEWSGQEAQTPLFKIKVEQIDTQKHKVENKSMAGLDWAGAAGVGAGSQKHPGTFIWTMIILIQRGKAQELESQLWQQVQNIRRQWLLIDQTRLFCIWEKWWRTQRDQISSPGTSQREKPYH